MNHKQFDLEQGILNCWNICEDMKVIAENVLEAKTVDRDKVANMLLGMADLYQLKFEKTFSDFEATRYSMLIVAIAAFIVSLLILLANAFHLTEIKFLNKINWSMVLIFKN
jgi:hypothetical protein